MTDALNPALASELDRFDVPPLSAGLADRIAVAAATPTFAPFAVSRRDRRGMWRRGRQVLLGTFAVGLLSAAAVASGFLGSVGIEVPVLTAMLAPKPKPAVKHVHHIPRAPVAQTATAMPPATIVDPAPVAIAPPLLPAERMALREERRERRQVFAAEDPVAAAAIRERVREQLRQRALARRQALIVPGIDPALPGVGRRLDLAERAALARAARRDRVVGEKMIDRRIQAREARIAERQGSGDDLSAVGLPGGPPAPVDATPRPLANGFAQRTQQVTPEERAARRARFQQMSPGERTQFRERMQQRRAMRGMRGRQNGSEN